MAASEKRTFSLPTEHAAFIDKLVDSGAYASGSEVIRDGLRALQAREAAIERWLREEVVQAHAEMKADPSRGLTTEQVMQAARQRHEARMKARM